MASEVKTHHELAPSSAPAIMQCACYESGYEEDNPFSEAKIGTALHDYSEALMEGRTPPEIEVLTDEHKEKCEIAADEIKAFCHSYYPGAEIFCEKSVKIYDANNNVVSEGTQDVDCPPDIGGDLKAGLDYKPKNHDYKPQQAFYALGRMQERKLDAINWFEYYIMPERLIPYTLSYDECIAIVRSVYARKYAKKKKPQICYFCRNCNNILYCPAVNRSLKMIADCYKDLPLPGNVHKSHEIIDGREMSKILVFAKDIIGPYIKRVKAIADKIGKDALALNDEGVPIPYFDRVGKSKSFIEDYNDTFTLLPEVSEKQFQDAMSLSVPKLADTYYQIKKQSGIKITKKKARNELEARLIRVLKSGDPTYSLQRKLKP